MKPDAADSAQRQPLLDLHRNRLGQGFHGDVLKADVVQIQQRPLAGDREITDGVVQIDADVPAADDQVAEAAAADFVVAGTAEPHPLTGALQHAVGHDHILRQAFGVPLPGPPGPDDQRIVAGRDETVADRNPFPAEEVQSVVVDHAGIAVDAKSGNRDILAFDQPGGPAGGVEKGHPFEPDVPAVNQLQQARTRLLRLRIEKSPFQPVAVVERRPAAFDHPAAGDGDIDGAGRRNQRLRTLAGGVLPVESGRQIVVLLRFGTSQQAASGGKMQLHIVAQVDRSAPVSAGGEDHFAPPGRRSLFDRVLHGIARSYPEFIHRLHFLYFAYRSTVIPVRECGLRSV